MEKTITLNEEEFVLLINLLRHMNTDLRFYEAEANERSPSLSSPLTVSLIEKSDDMIKKLREKKL